MDWLTQILQAFGLAPKPSQTLPANKPQAAPGEAHIAREHTEPGVHGPYQYRQSGHVYEKFTDLNGPKVTAGATYTAGDQAAVEEAGAEGGAVVSAVIPGGGKIFTQVYDTAPKILSGLADAVGLGGNGPQLSPEQLQYINTHSGTKDKAGNFTDPAKALQALGEAEGLTDPNQLKSALHNNPMANQPEGAQIVQLRLLGKDDKQIPTEDL